jgi:Heme/copper-type cytochrome/quinol oxidase, subunit 3
MEQQAEASTLGMWVFLVTEVMFFGGLFTAYLVYRWSSPEGFAEASNHLNVYWGAANTIVLIVSSLTMALAVRAAQTSAPPKTQVGWLIATMVLGSAFLGVKVIEYSDKFKHHTVPGPNFVWEGKYPQAAEQFYSLYFCMTGLHALHMIIGLGIMTVISIMAWRRQFNSEYYTPVEVSGLYWHFVDIVWIFLFPLLYLIGFHYGGTH